MQFDQDDEKGFAEMEAALAVRDRERENARVERYYTERGLETLRRLSLQPVT